MRNLIRGEDTPSNTPQLKVPTRSRSSGFNTVRSLGPDSMHLSVPSVTHQGFPHLRLLASARGPAFPTCIQWLNYSCLTWQEWALVLVLVSQIHPPKPCPYSTPPPTTLWGDLQRWRKGLPGEDVGRPLQLPVVFLHESTYPPALFRISQSRQNLNEGLVSTQ